MVEFVRSRGGILDETDFAEYRAEVTEPLRIDYRGYTVYDSSPTCFDHVTLESLKILEGFDLKALGPNAPEYLHYLSEVMKLAFADRDATVASPRFPNGMEQILTDAFTKTRCGLIHRRRAMELTPAGEYTGASDRPHLAVQDSREGKAVYASQRGGSRETTREAAHPRWIDGLTT